MASNLEIPSGISQESSRYRLCPPGMQWCRKHPRLSSTTQEVAILILYAITTVKRKISPKEDAILFRIMRLQETRFFLLFLLRQHHLFVHSRNSTKNERRSGCESNIWGITKLHLDRKKQDYLQRSQEASLLNRLTQFRGFVSISRDKKKCLRSIPARSY